MTSSAANEAVREYRRRLGQKGLARFEVLGLAKDRELIRSLAKRLARQDADAARLRHDLGTAVHGPDAGKGGVLAGLLRAPRLIDEIEIERDRVALRDVDL